MDLFEEIKVIICEQLKAKPEEVKSETSFIGDIGADSLDLVELVMELEERYNIEIPDEDAEKMDTVSDVVECIENKINRTPKAENK